MSYGVFVLSGNCPIGNLSQRVVEDNSCNRRHFSLGWLSQGYYPVTFLMPGM